MLATVQHRTLKFRHENVCRLAVAALGFALPLGVLATAFAQSSPPRTIQAERSKDTSKLDAIRARDIELEAIRAQQKQSAETEATLKREIAAIGDDRRKLNQALIDTAARLRNLEGRIAQAENRLTLLEDSERAMRESWPAGAI